MSNQKRFLNREWIIEALFLLTALACMLTFVFLQPFGEGPDEINRFRVVQYIYKYGRLPKGDSPEVLIPGYGGSYAFQPMLPYIIQGYLARFVSLFTERFDVLLITARLVNVFFGMTAAIYIRKSARLLFPESITAWFFSCLAVFLPQSIFLHTYVNTDSCAVLSVCIMFYAVLKGMKEGFPLSANLQLALGVILCALSYYNAYGAILASILLFVISHSLVYDANSLFPDGTASPKKRVCLYLRPLLRKGLMISGIVLLGIGWWFIRNAVLYHGDLLGMQARNACVASTCTPPYHPLLRQTYQNQGISVFRMVFETDYFILLCRSFVAMFGPMNLPTHYYIYVFYYWILGLGSIAALIPVGSGLYLDWLRQKRRWFFNGCMALACLIPIILCVYYSYTWDFQPQGKYLMPMLPPFMYFVTLGIRKIIGIIQDILDRSSRSILIHLGDLLPCLIMGAFLLLILLALFYSLFAVVIPHYVVLT